MPDKMRFDLVSPEGIIASQDAAAIDLPVSEGDMTAMPDHAALIATLKPGLIRAYDGNSRAEFFVSGGLVEVGADSTTVLAEQACKRSDVTSKLLDSLTAKAEDELQEAIGPNRDLAEIRLACVKSVRSELQV